MKSQKRAYFVMFGTILCNHSLKKYSFIEFMYREYVDILKAVMNMNEL